jgi:hypothetical protein
MKIKYLLIIFLLITTLNCYSQSFDSKAKNIIYIDLGVFLSRGIGTLGIGLNYERMLSNNVSIRAGVNIGIFGVAEGGDGFSGTGVSFPVTINYLTNNKNKFEAGIGGGPHFETGNYKDKGVSFFPAIKLGYRYQPDEKSAIFKIGAEVPANFYLSFAGVGYHF